MFVNKWYTLAASAVLQLVAGVAYTFSLYAPSLKSALHFSQPQLEGVGSAILCGGLTAWIPGLLYDYLANYSKLAPRLTAAVGVLFHVAGYSLIWAAAKGHVSVPYWSLIVAGLVASTGLLWLDTASMATCMRNFPTERGSIAGILKTFLGLSASIATTVYGGLFAPSGIDFLLFLALGPAALGFLAVPFMNHVPHVEENEIIQPGRRLTTERRLLAICGAIGLLLVYQMLSALFAGPDRSQKFPIMVVALALLVATIVSIPLGTGGVKSRPARSHVSEAGESSPASPLLASAAGESRVQRRSGSSALEEGNQVEAARQEEGPTTPVRETKSAAASREWTLRQCLGSIDYWILWLGLFIGIGSGFTLLNNFGQHVEALRARQGAQQIYVLLFATFNCLGRMICGFGSEWLLHKYALPRTAVLLFGSAATAAVYFVVAFANLQVLLVVSVLAGLTFGAHWALLPSLTADLFGPRHFAANQSILHLSTAVGALLLSTELAGTLFDARGKAHGDPGTTCIGPDCFRAVYLSIAGLALLQTGLSTILLVRSRQLYWQLHIKLRRLEAETNA